MTRIDGEWTMTYQGGPRDGEAVQIEGFGTSHMDPWWELGPGGAGELSVFMEDAAEAAKVGAEMPTLPLSVVWYEYRLASVDWDTRHVVYCASGVTKTHAERVAHDLKSGGAV